jgi:AAA domain-containing protein
MELELAERTAATLSLDALRDLIEWWECGGEPNMSPPLCLGWDIHRQWPNEGFEVWRDLMHCYEPPFLARELLGPSDPRVPETVERYEEKLIEKWAGFAREKRWADALIVDVMHSARGIGWLIGGPAIEATEAILDDLARRSGAKRAAAEADRKAEEARYKAEVDAEDDADFAAYQKWIADGEPAYEPMTGLDHRERKRRFLDVAHRRTEQIEIRDAAENEWLAFGGSATAEEIDAWKEKHKRLMIPFQRILEPVTILQFRAAPLPDLLTSSAEFIGAFVPPEFLIDGIVQRRYFYSMTAQTGVGKTSIAMRWMAHVVACRPIGDSEVQQGSVLYFAGENPDDVRARWLVLSREMGIDPNTDKVTWIVGAKDLNATAQQISAEVARKGLNLAYVVVDTAAAYNMGDDENSNTQAGTYARQLRSLTSLPGGPCVVVLCHPTKRAGDDDLMPRGGGAFLAEVDGNTAAVRKDSLLVVAPFGKFRGDMSWSQRFEIEVVKDHPKLKDARGRQMNSVLARPVAAGVAAVMEKRTDADMETVLAAVYRTPSATPTELARLLGWNFGPKAEPNVNKVKRNLARLVDDKLVRETLGKWRVTPAGEKELNAIDMARTASPPPLPPLPRLH